MAIPLNDNITTNAPKPSDSRYGPYTDLATAKASLGSAIRYIGLTVGIGSPVAEYWFKNGVTDSDLIAKIPDAYIFRHDYQSPYDYLGKAISGSAESANVWLITRLNISSDGSTIIQSATNVAWTNRYSVIYT
jgi:hypothetical protein